MVTEVRTCDPLATLSDLQARFGLVEATAADFFGEWQQDLPALNEAQQQALAALKQRYDYHRPDGQLLPGTASALALVPLLDLVGFLDPPFRLRSTHGLLIAGQQPGQRQRGFVESYVIQEQLWIFAIEAAQASVPLAAVLPELLAQMLMAAGLAPIHYALLSNGDEFAFLKLHSLDVSEQAPHYALSHTFSLFSQASELATVAQILLRLGECLPQQPAL